MTESVILACEAKERPKGHGAWVGVQLTHSGEENSQIVIGDVQRNSPAQEAGLQTGDVITQVDGKPVGSFEAFLDEVQNAGPGHDLPLTIDRNGEKQEKVVKVGRLADAPVSWQRRSFDTQHSQFGNRAGQTGTGDLDESMEQILDEFRQRIRTLEQQIQALKAKDNAASVRPRGDLDELDSIALQAVAASPILVVAPDHRLYRNNSRWYGQRQRGYYGNNWYNRGWYPGGNYNHYRSPRYGNYYYNYGGRPYYHSGPYWNGYQSGVQIGPNGISYRW